MRNISNDIIFPHLGARVISSVVHFVGSAVLAFCLARRTAEDGLLSDLRRDWRNSSYARLYVILVFFDSLIFVVFTGILIHGIGLELSHATCSLGIFACIFLYTSSKILIYSFLSERVWLVWSNNASVTKRSRWSSPVYRICAGSIMVYCACITLLIVYRVATLDHETGVCHIGIQKFVSVALVVYDTYITLLLTGLFVYPMWRDKVKSPRLRRMALRTLIAAFVALATSTVNVGILLALHGHELGWVCLASCGTDVTVNALVLYFVTERRPRRSNDSRRAPNQRNANMAVLDGLAVLGIDGIKNFTADPTDGGRRNSAWSRRSSAFSTRLRRFAKDASGAGRGRFWQRRHQLQFPDPAQSEASTAAVPDPPSMPEIIEDVEHNQTHVIAPFHEPRSALSPESHLDFAKRPRSSDDERSVASSCRTGGSLSGESLSHQKHSSPHPHRQTYTDPVTAMRDQSNPRGERLLSLEDMLQEGALECPEGSARLSSPSPPVPRVDMQTSMEDLHASLKSRRLSAPDNPLSVPSHSSLKSPIPFFSQPTLPTLDVPPPRSSIPFLPRQVPKPTPESTALFGTWKGFQPTATPMSRFPASPNAKGPRDEPTSTSQMIDLPPAPDTSCEVSGVAAEIDIADVRMSIDQR
ncbi:uncharacterized protein EI90DRAFT_3035823 [Cantharellus anzutake]|uniref:uncharacterized protein n=1 Tax=Cantharellus anzutake TaxID=1750568 RepID=UPI001903CB12|nr:uncharacterized protein EI90DRAFT_3035823 [Cantharellus anzutake]KAF8340508.1 hypothetical protein EI90DRAFT_3035823 [Cantharellus anzutake]